MLTAGSIQSQLSLKGRQFWPVFMLWQGPLAKWTPFPERFPWLASHRRSHPCRIVHPPATKPPRSGGPPQCMRISCPVKGRTTTDLKSGSCLAFWPMCKIILYPVVQAKMTIGASQVSCPLILWGNKEVLRFQLWQKYVDDVVGCFLSCTLRLQEQSRAVGLKL